jgi:hypothetical protein
MKERTLSTITRIRLSIATAVATVWLFIPATLAANGLSLHQITQSAGWTSREGTTVSTAATFTDGQTKVYGGIRGHRVGWNISLEADFPLASTRDWTSSRIRTLGQLALGREREAAVNASVGYSQTFQLGSAALCYDVGIQASATTVPDVPQLLYNFAPRYGLEASLEALERITISVGISSVSRYSFAIQAMSPMAQARLACDVTDHISVGFEYLMQFSDIFPETTIIIRQEATAYVAWNR